MFLSNVFKDLEGQDALVLAEEVAEDSHHIELQQPPELGIENLAQNALIFLRPLQRLHGLDGFDAEEPPLLQRPRVVASVSHCNGGLQSLGI